MKKIIITNASDCVETGDNSDLHLSKFEIEGPEEMEVYDGYHTFTELYNHRIALFIAFCSVLNSINKISIKVDVSPLFQVWRSKIHSDGSSFEGWFILGFNKNKGEQITYHLPISEWKNTNFAETLEKAPEWDGHTSNDVLERLKKFYVE